MKNSFVFILIWGIGLSVAFGMFFNVPFSKFQNAGEMLGQSIPTISPFRYFGVDAIRPVSSTTKVLIGSNSTTTDSYLETPSLTITELANEDCIGTDGDGVVISGTCTGGGGGGGESLFTYDEDNNRVYLPNSPTTTPTTTVYATAFTGSSTVATSTLPRLSVTTAINFLGTYITNVSTWFNGLFDTQLATKDTGDLAEGSSLYFTDERAQDAVGGGLTGNTETLITVTYQDGDGTIDFVVDNDLANYSNASSAFLTGNETVTLSGDITGSGATSITTAIGAGVIIETDLDGDVAPVDGDYLQYDSTGTNFTWREASEVRSDLSLVIGTNVQAYDADLTTYAGITPSANVQSLLGAANYGAMRTLLDLEAGTDFYSISAADSAFEAELNNSAGLLAALSDEVGTGFAVFNSSPSITSPTLTSFFGTPCTGNNFLQDISDTGAFTCTEATGSSGGGGSLSTTTDNNAEVGEVVSYITSDFYIGGNASNTAEFNFDKDSAKLTISSTTASAGSITLDGALILVSSAGSATLDFIDSLGSTAEATIESAIDTLGNLTSASALATVGTITSGTWNATIADNLIVEPDLNADNSPGDTDYLQYDSTGTNFVWRTLAEVASDLEASLESGLDTLSSLVTVAISTTLAIPFGTTCDSNSDGEICQDTSDNQLIVDGNAVPTTGIKIMGRTVASTSPAFIAGGTMPLTTQLDGFTITRIQCTVDSGTNKVIAIEDASGNSSEDITCTTSNTTDDGSITNATYTASEEWYIDFGSTSGSVDYVNISVFGTWTRE